MQRILATSFTFSNALLFLLNELEKLINLLCETNSTGLSKAIAKVCFVFYGVCLKMEIVKIANLSLTKWTSGSQCNVLCLISA